MKLRFQVVMVIAAVAMAGSIALGQGQATMVMSSSTLLGDGNWEYIYDVYTDNSPYIVNVGLSGFATADIVNQFGPITWGPYTGTLPQKWDWNAGHNPLSWERTPYGSYSTDSATWTLHGEPWSIDNPWHVPNDYVYGTNCWGSMLTSWVYIGQVDGPNESLQFSANRMGPSTTGLILTFRIVHPNEPGTVNYWIYSYYGGAVGNSGPIVGPSSGGVEGDFDGNGEVNALDIDILCDNMGSLDPVYDLDDGSGTGTPDGVVDEDDMIYHVEKLVELQDGSGRLGSKRGDFNLDGFVDGTDLALMKAAFGQPDQTYADGNANCDLLVDGTDLAILKSNMGFIAPTGGGVPEPVTIGLLALGGLALLRRRRR